MSFIGSRLSVYLHNNQYDVVAIEDIANVDKNPVKWYRWTELNKLGITAYIKDYSRDLKNLLDKHNPQIVTYIPHNHFTGQRLKKVLKNFVKLLDIIKEKKSQLIVASQKGNIWSNTFHYILKSYVNEHCISAASVQLKGLFGPWQDNTQKELFDKSTKLLYIDSVVEQLNGFYGNVPGTTVIDELSKLLRYHIDKLQSDNTEKVSQTLDWLVTYNNGYTGKRNVAFTAALRDVSKSYSRSNTFEDINAASLFRYFQRWITSANAVGLHTVVFSDIFNDGFIERAKSRFKEGEFLKAKAVNKRSPNDQRLYMIYNYLLSHPEINIAISTDSRDVRFVFDPVTVLSGMGNYYFVGTDVTFFTYVGDSGWMENIFNGCFPKFKNKEQVYKLYGFFNVGVMAGTRVSMLNLLSHLIALLEVADSGTICDMGALQVVTHSEEFYDELYFGYPFNAGFKHRIPGPFGIAIKHKDIYKSDLD